MLLIGMEITSVSKNFFHKNYLLIINHCGRQNNILPPKDVHMLFVRISEYKRALDDPF